MYSNPNYRQHKCYYDYEYYNWPSQISLCNTNYYCQYASRNKKYLLTKGLPFLDSINTHDSLVDKMHALPVFNQIPEDPIYYDCDFSKKRIVEHVYGEV